MNQLFYTSTLEGKDISILHLTFVTEQVLQKSQPITHFFTHYPPYFFNVRHTLADAHKETVFTERAVKVEATVLSHKYSRQK